MTDRPTPGDTATARTKKVDPADLAHRLSVHVRGVLTIHFEHGAVVRHPISQFDARTFLDKQRGEESSDEVTWDARKWFSWADERVVFSTFEADRDQNWDVTPEERRALVDAGHARGVIDSLVRMWEIAGRVDEPRYSVSAIASLHQMAVDGAEHRIWETAARAVEGQPGALRLADILSQAESPESPARNRHHRVSDDLVDDSIQPDEASTSDNQAQPDETDATVTDSGKPEQHGSDEHGRAESADPGSDAPS